MPKRPHPKQQQQIKSKVRSQDVPDVRAKPSGHKKKTADKWNQ